jgi:tetratricopeptide (TPR) repeat protein
MRADHRHDLKTNILAEWLGNFPQWAKDNLTTVIAVTVVVAVAAGFYIWRSHGKSAQVQEHLRFTSLVNQISTTKMQILSAQAQGADRSFILLKPADALKTFADSTTDDNLAAMALIKRAEALRTELHYRLAAVSSQDLLAQLTRARESYTEAVEKSSSNPSLRAAAKFGLGLCEEELGNFDKARQTYREIADDPAFDGTVAVTQAKLRLETMADYKGNVVFRPKPKPKPVMQPKPIDIESFDPNRFADMGPRIDPNLFADANLAADTNRPPDVNWPEDANQPAETNLPAHEPNNAAGAEDTDLTPKEPNTVSEVPDVNAASQDANSLSAAADANVPSK